MECSLFKSKQTFAAHVSYYHDKDRISRVFYTLSTAVVQSIETMVRSTWFQSTRRCDDYFIILLQLLVPRTIIRRTSVWVTKGPFILSLLVHDWWLWHSDCLFVDWVSRPIRDQNFAVTVISPTLKRLNVNGP